MSSATPGNLNQPLGGPFTFGISPGSFHAGSNYEIFPAHEVHQERTTHGYLPSPVASPKSSGVSTPKESAGGRHDLPSIDLIKRLLSVKLRERVSTDVVATVTKIDLLSGIKKKGNPPGRIPRPSNSFMTYRKAVKPLLLEQFPYLNNKDLSVVIGQMWGQEEKHIKDHFAKLAEEAKKRHKELYPHYKFQPAKPKPKKHSAAYGRTHLRAKQFLESISELTVASEVPSLFSSPAPASVIDFSTSPETNGAMFTGGFVSRSPSPETMMGLKPLWIQETSFVPQQNVLPEGFFQPDHAVQTCCSCSSRFKYGPPPFFSGENFVGVSPGYMNSLQIPIFNEQVSMSNELTLPMLTDLELQQLLAEVRSMSIINPGAAGSWFLPSDGSNY